LGVKIDTVSSILIISAIGLSVDFSAHIAHTFMTFSASRTKRARATLVDIGPAVLHGGVTTMLAFSLMYFSEAFVLRLFCKVYISISLYYWWLPI
jgi:predicted RND superfamily exporter protein